MINKKLFDLIDDAYNENLSKEPSSYRKCLLTSAQNLLAGREELKVCADIYNGVIDSRIYTITLPPKNHVLYKYVLEQLKPILEKQYRQANLGYGLSMLPITFGNIFKF